MRYQRLDTPQGSFVVGVPNTVLHGEGFYVSHNDHDIRTYGGETTALVIGQMQRFYILKGDHRESYAPLIAKGLEACLSYFRSQPDQWHEHSDNPRC